MLLGTIDIPIADIARDDVARQSDLHGERGLERQNGNLVFAATVALGNLSAQ
jgi:hypothetical protein